MKPISEKLDSAGRRYYFFEDQREQTFDDVVLGVGWAGASPGYVCAAAMTVAEGQFQRQVDVIQLLADHEEKALPDLLRIVSDFKINYHASGVYCFPSETADIYLARYNRQYPSYSQRRLKLRWAPFANDNGKIEYHLQLLLDRLSRSNKTLYVGNKSIAHSALVNFQDGVIHKATAQDYPSLAGLGAAIATLTQKESRPDPRNLPRRAILDRSEERQDQSTPRVWM